MINPDGIYFGSNLVQSVISGTTTVWEPPVDNPLEGAHVAWDFREMSAFPPGFSEWYGASDSSFLDADFDFTIEGLIIPPPISIGGGDYRDVSQKVHEFDTEIDLFDCVLVAHLRFGDDEFDSPPTMLKFQLFDTNTWNNEMSVAYHASNEFDFTTRVVAYANNSSTLNDDYTLALNFLAGQEHVAIVWAEENGRHTLIIDSDGNTIVSETSPWDNGKPVGKSANDLVIEWEYDYTDKSLGYSLGTIKGLYILVDPEFSNAKALAIVEALTVDSAPQQEPSPPILPPPIDSAFMAVFAKNCFAYPFSPTEPKTRDASLNGRIWNNYAGGTPPVHSGNHLALLANTTYGQSGDSTPFRPRTGEFTIIMVTNITSGRSGRTNLMTNCVSRDRDPGISGFDLYIDAAGALRFFYHEDLYVKQCSAPGNLTVPLDTDITIVAQRILYPTDGPGRYRTRLAINGSEEISGPIAEEDNPDVNPDQLVILLNRSQFSTPPLFGCVQNLVATGFWENEALDGDAIDAFVNLSS